MNYISRTIKNAFPGIVLTSLLFIIPALTFAQNKTYNIAQLGAKGDDKTLNTDIINKAITQCFNEGGGTVVVPQGVFVTSTIYLKSNVNINLQKGAVLKGTSNINLYKSYIPVKDLSKYSTISTEGNNSNSAYDTVWMKALIIAEGANNMKIYGEGTISGEHVFNPKGEENMRGPHTIVIANSSNISLENITIEKAANYAILAYNIENAVFKGVHIQQGWDGIHIRGGKNVLLKKCELQTGDDAIAGGFWENFKVDDCVINSACNGIRVIMPVNGFYVTNSKFVGPGKYPHRTSGAQNRTNMLAGIYIQPGGWGKVKGDVEGVRISNLKMHNMNNPFIFELHDGNNANDITVENVTADSIKNPIAIHSDKGYGYKSILFKNVKVSYTTNATTQAPWALGAANVENLRLQNVKFFATGQKPQIAIKLDNITASSFIKTNVYSKDNTTEVEAANSGKIETGK
ncbi:glycoside hydrolase [Mucilaginibacter sp. JRF]|uniref:glycoside hydrolase family 28 protein n=1 Tax=Mucilaginibacter sp. JRF TaxID=2780088 RepID=UPI0018819D38|nr:glycosyl hydrolase family 28 protein [Mucilaginibacter sp. JRF]MBE9584293.1 glycoside hydrolase [Mucilaginibacter sp. JRF]